MRYLVGEAMTGGYGDADILHDCTIGVDEGEIAVVVGPNGAGKSTAMKAVFGMLGLRSGRVLMDGEDITALKPQERVRKGMGFVPQTNNVSPIVMDELFDRIIEVARTGIAILMVEQNAKQALHIADKGFVLVQGRNRYTDTGQALLADNDVRKAFLGG